jgi:predicted lipoprotein with Yx(FWY)xxD motif
MSAGYKTPVMAAVTAALGLTLAACGSSSSGSTARPGTSTAATSGVSLTLRQTGDGTALALVGGHMLYLWVADKGSSSTCYGPCASEWPPIVASGPVKATGGVTAALIGATKRNDGTRQVTYAGHPLYGYAADTSPTSVTGEGSDSFGAEWDLLRGSGSKIDDVD